MVRHIQAGKDRLLFAAGESHLELAKVRIRKARERNKGKK
jgi:hypothetical protein